MASGRLWGPVAPRAPAGEWVKEGPMTGRRCTGRPAGCQGADGWVGTCRQRRHSDGPMLSSAPLAERSHSGLVRRFAKPLKGVFSSEGSNPSLSPPAIVVAYVPVAQWIERQVADLKAGGSSPLGHAKHSRTNPHKRASAS